MSRRRVQADCKADTRGGRWAGVPVCVIESAAYRHCSVHARAALIELVARMNGYNNGKIALSQRQLVQALGCSPRKVVRGIAELMECGLIDVHAEGKWKERMAREYRLTFVSTKLCSATNDYRHWRPLAKTGAITQVAESVDSATAAIAIMGDAVSALVAAKTRTQRKSAKSENPPASEAVSLISKPYGGPASWWSADFYYQGNRAILSLFKAEILRAAA